MARSCVVQLPGEQSIILKSPTMMSLLFWTVSVAIQPMVLKPEMKSARPMYWVTSPILDHLLADPQYGISSPFFFKFLNYFSQILFKTTWLKVTLVTCLLNEWDLHIRLYLEFQRTFEAIFFGFWMCRATRLPKQFWAKTHTSCSRSNPKENY